MAECELGKQRQIKHIFGRRISTGKNLARARAPPSEYRSIWPASFLNLARNSAKFSQKIIIKIAIYVILGDVFTSNQDKEIDFLELIFAEWNTHLVECKNGEKNATNGENNAKLNIYASRRKSTRI